MEIKRGGPVYLVEVSCPADFDTFHAGLINYRGEDLLFGGGVSPLFKLIIPTYVLTIVGTTVRIVPISRDIGLVLGTSATICRIDRYKSILLFAFLGCHTTLRQFENVRNHFLFRFFGFTLKG